MIVNVNGILKELTYKVWNGTSYSEDKAIDIIQDGTWNPDDEGHYTKTPEEYNAAISFLKALADDNNMEYHDHITHHVFAD